METERDRVVTLSVSKHDKNFLLSPINIALLRIGTSTLSCSSIGTGAMFSPPAVMINSETKNGLQMQLQRSDFINPKVSAWNLLSF